jgi:hypothetical protein
LGKWIVERTTEIGNWIASLPSKIGQWAKNLWSGFWAGLSDGWNDFLAGFSSTQNNATGGMVRNRNSGGMIYRNVGGDVPGQGNTDTVSAMLTPGEYVVNKRATAKFRPVLKAINSGTFGGGLATNRYKVQPPKYSPSNLSEGVYSIPSRAQSSGASASMFASQTTTATQMDNSVYNYSLSVNVNGSNASADDIASTVIDKIKRIDSQRLRRQVVS